MQQLLIKIALADEPSGHTAHGSGDPKPRLCTAPAGPQLKNDLGHAASTRMQQQGLQTFQSRSISRQTPSLPSASHSKAKPDAQAILTPGCNPLAAVGVWWLQATFSALHRL